MTRKKEKDAMIVVHEGWEVEMTGTQMDWSAESVTGCDGKPLHKIEISMALDYQTQLKSELAEHQKVFAEVQRLVTDVDIEQIDDPKLLGLIEATSVALGEWQKLFEAIEFLREGYFDFPRPEA